MQKILLSLLFFGLLLNASVYDGVAIVVKDKAITLLEIKQKMQELNVNAKNASDVLIREALESIELQKRKISVNSSEIYDEIKKTAQRNNMSINDFYEAVRNSNGLSSAQLKDKIEARLLSQKLYMEIAYTAMSEPDEEEIQEYYKLHKEDYQHPASFTVIIYSAQNKARVEEKVHNPMFYSPELQTQEKVLPYSRISPELASLLEKTELNHFTPVIPNGQNGYMSFYIKAIESAKEGGLESVRAQIVNSIMSEKREIALSNYFGRLRQNTKIKTLRLPE